MNVIDKILEEWSFRCHDGIVDLNDPIKLSILNEIIGFDLDEARQPYESLTGAAKKEADKLIELFGLTKDNIQKQTSNRIIILSDIPRNEVFKKLQDLEYKQDKNISGSSVGGFRTPEGIEIIVKSEIAFNTFLPKCL